jgi:LacI family transcriptional regulator
MSFKNELFSTVHEEITRIRLKKVRLLLQETDMSIAKIARETGFNNENYLSYVFRKYEHMTMSDYRKNGILLHQQ